MKTNVTAAVDGGKPTPTKTRHPVTGELIDNESDWKDAKGNWLETKFNETTKQHEPISPSLGGGTKGGGSVGPDENPVIQPQAGQKKEDK